MQGEVGRSKSEELAREPTFLWCSDYGYELIPNRCPVLPGIN